MLIIIAIECLWPGARSYHHRTFHDPGDLPIDIRTIMAQWGWMAAIQDARDLADFIAASYSGRVVEVGVGYLPTIAQLLSESGIDVVLTDKEERFFAGLTVKKDDIFAPRMDLYQGASLIYSIRPPLELQIAIGSIAAQINADMLIRPLEDEVAELAGFKRRLINSGRSRFYLFRVKDAIQRERSAQGRTVY